MSSEEICQIAGPQLLSYVWHRSITQPALCMQICPCVFVSSIIAAPDEKRLMYWSRARV